MLRGALYPDFFKPVAEHEVAAFCEHRFWVELHTVHGCFAVAQPHNDAVFGGGGNLQHLGHGVGDYGKRVVAGRREGAWDVFEHRIVFVHQGGGFTVHKLGGVGDGAAEGFSDCLVSQAHTQQGFAGVSGPLDGVDNDSGVCRGTGTG